MSFVATVLQVSSKQEKEELSKSLVRLSQQLDDTKRQLHQDVTDRYLDFHAHCARTADLSARVGQLLGDATQLQAKIDEHLLQQLHSSTSEFHQLSAQLQETKTALQVLHQLVQVEESMDAAKDAQTRGDHFERARKVKDAEELLPPLSCGKDATEVTTSTSVPSAPGEELSLLKALREAVVLQREILLFDLGEAWKGAWLLEEADGEGLEVGDDALCSKVMLQVRQQSPGQLHALAASLRLHGELDVKLRRLGSRVLSTLVRPMGRRRARVMTTPECMVALICKEETVPAFASVVENLKAVVDFLWEAFGPEDDSVMRCFGSAVSKDFCEFFLRECVLPNVPNSGRDLDAYTQVLEVLEGFQRHLESRCFLDAASGRMLDHARDVDALLANHLSRRLLVQARALMLEDLQNTEEIAEDEQPASAQQPRNPFSFPRCRVSCSTRKLLSLIESALEEACSSTPVCAGRLLHTCRGALELYCSVVPQHHSRGLESVPEQCALLHNNCMYLAHRVLLCTNRIRPNLPPPLCEDTLTLADMAPVLRQTGTQSLLRQMRRQRQHFYDALKDGFPTLAAAAAAPAADRSLQRCLLQLGHLERVWRPVLPIHVYRRTMGTLLNSVLEELLVRVTTVEDIPADCAVYLVTVLGAFLDQAPGVFRDEAGKDVGLAELCRLVPKWEKFRELVRVLDASLRELEERWAEGKGPLADHFSPDELKHLIRALFQNTDRRAAVLANIK